MEISRSRMGRNVSVRFLCLAKRRRLVCFLAMRNACSLRVTVALGLGLGSIGTGGCGANAVAKPAEPLPRIVNLSRVNQPSKGQAVEPQADVAPAASKDRIGSVIEAHQSAISGCHTIQFSGKPAQPGSVTLLLTVRRDGTVGHAALFDSSFDTGPFSRCLLDVAWGLHFPEADEVTEVAWRFAFSASNDPERGSRASLH
jgi:hypothetical protein